MPKELDTETKAALIKNLTENLPVLRAKLGVTQAELAARVGVSRQTIISIEMGKRAMSWGTFVALTLLFLRNESTKVLLPVVKVYTRELDSFFRFGSEENIQEGDQ
ncbi:helix-turn-helix transcriptional regulator [Paenibacillus aurantiacus]|uniref:Helix-turn-helix transcriptional regulator n=1 Tax=Paenibacillus aurantiacus TaxID=1936118 RepID=A0ABV5KIB8_9BACL